MLIVCALATASVTVRGSSLDHFCHGCKRRLMVSPSGLARMKEHPDLQPSCMECLPSNTEFDVRFSAHSLEEMQQERKAVIPNTWKDRN